MKGIARIFLLFTLCIFVGVTSASAAMPSVSHKVTQSNKAEKSEASKGHDCHGHGEAKATSDKAAQNDKDSDKCCDKGMCKCIGGTCHNGISKIFGNGGTPLFTLNTSSSCFDLTDEFIDSALLEGLKRPPKV